MTIAQPTSKTATANPAQGKEPETFDAQEMSAELMQAAADNDTATDSAGEARTGSQWQSPYGKSLTNNMWYFAVPGDSLKPGQMVSKTMLNEPVLVGRDQDGKVFAMRDICPHQAVKLSAGTFDGKEVACPFHGWRFDTAGVCTDVPSLCSNQQINLGKICTRSFHCREVLGSVWVYFGSVKSVDDLPEVPYAPGLEGASYHKTTTTLLLPTHIDYAVAALIDTAHVPFVHKSWWWRSQRSMKEKAKTYVPSGTGWTMVKHKPSQHSIVFKLIGKYIETEISFRLPGCRREYISFHDKTMISGITTLTPIDDTHTELNHTTYWTPAVIKPFRPLVTPIVDYFVTTFLKQDQTLAIMQSEILGKYNPRLIMTIKDAGTPGHWYFLLKKEWNEATAKGRPFVNPIRESILRWRT
ncbi:MAG: aromatic ring-hydroxylating dioxygenase subunit alpha [Cyanobacteria bacterium SZAS LIN-2]|nr:aromatic ring-hydroxylating dioxygenase subunit alpha [Cyanobacteria bacterium SZAS LIN-3]MBS1996340.1 aromatic ring-hydroxylating dioxygenase subunit alpha [Cyanobacteria bacterium SZAS LIN-2]